MASNDKRAGLWLLILLLASVPAAAQIDPGPPQLVSVRANGQTAFGLCINPRYSGDSKWLFFSCNDRLLPEDDNGVYDVYVRDPATGGLERISLTSQGEQIFFRTTRGLPNFDGSQVVLSSRGPLHPDWVEPPPNQNPDQTGRATVYLRDRRAGTTELISRNFDGVAIPDEIVLTDALPDHALILMQTRRNLFGGPPLSASQIWLRNWITGEIELISVSRSGGISFGVAGVLSPDGRYAAFLSNADDLVDNPPAELGTHVYLRDRWLGTTRRLSFPWHGGEFQSEIPLGIGWMAFSPDGTRVFFSSGNNELIPGDSGFTPKVFQVDLDSGQITLLTTAFDGGRPNGQTFPAALSANGRYLVFHSRAGNILPPAGNPPEAAIYVEDRLTGERVNLTASLGPPPELGFIPDIAIRPDGTAVAFTWRVNHLPDTPFGTNRDLVYEVQLRGVRPPPPPVPVPGLGRVAVGLLMLLVLLAAGRALRPLP